jgi:ribosomal protein S1
LTIKTIPYQHFLIFIINVLCGYFKPYFKKYIIFTKKFQSKMLENIQSKWSKVLKKYKKGQFISGIVCEHRTFGFFLDINEYPVFGLIRVTEITDNIDENKNIYDYFPSIGDKINGVIIEMIAYNCQVIISIRASTIGNFSVMSAI